MDTNLFGEVICSYTRKQAFEDGYLINAMEGDLEEVSRNYYKYPIAMTNSVFALIEKAVENKIHHNDFRGVWSDILNMSKLFIVKRLDSSSSLFQVTITGTGKKRVHTLKIVCGPDDNAEPVLTIMLPDED